MKHLTNYKLFESDETQLIEYLEDICLDLNDEGYTARVSGMNSNSRIIVVDVVKIKEGSYIMLTYDDVKETFNRMKNYMESVGWEKSKIEFWRQKFSGGYMDKYIPSNKEDIKTRLFAITFSK